MSFDGNISSLSLSLSLTVSFSPCEKEIKIPRKGPGVFVEKIEKIEIEIIKVEINIIWLIYNFDIFFNLYTFHGSGMLLIRRQRTCRDFVSVEIFSNQTFIVSIFFWRSIRFLRKLSINVNCQLLMIYGYSMSYKWDRDDFVLVPRDSLFIDGFKHRHES